MTENSTARRTRNQPNRAERRSATHYGFTFFKPARPKASLSDRKYAAVHARQTTPTETSEVTNLKALQQWIESRAVEGRKGDAGYIVAGECVGERSGDCVGPASFALIDYDGAEPDWEALDSYRGFAWTTASHSPTHPAWRVVIPFKRPAAHGELVSPFPGAYIRNRSQPAFLPTARPGTEVQWRDLTGTQSLDAAELEKPSRARHAARPSLRLVGRGESPDLSPLAEELPPAGQNGDRHKLTRALGGWLVRRGFSPSEIADAVRDLPSSDPEFRASQAREAAERVLQGLEAPGWTALGEWCETWAKGARTLGRLVKACRDPAEPDGFDGIWSVWWRENYPRLVSEANERREARKAAAVEAGTYPAVDMTGLYLHASDGNPWILQRGTSYWMHSESEPRYGKQFPHAELPARVARHLAGVISEDERTQPELVAKLISPVELVVFSYTDLNTTYEKGTRTVRVAALDRMPPERATYHEPIDRWLRALFSDDYERGTQWLASCASLDRVAPCLYLIGKRELGKSLLFDGLARLWGQSSPVDMAETIDNFNEKQCECPLTYSDEGLPPGLEFNRFRSLITAHDRSVNRKHLAKVNVEGCVRVAIGANNDGVLRWARTGELTQDDQDAIVSRLLVIRCGEGAKEALPPVPDAWARHMIAEHVLHLAKATMLESGGRMCVEPHGGEALIRAVVNDRYAPIALAITEVLSGGGRARDAAHVWRSKRDDRVIFVHVEQLYQYLAGRGEHRSLRVGDVREACRALARPGGDVTAPQRLPGSELRPRVYELDAEKVGGAAGVKLP